MAAAQEAGATVELVAVVAITTIIAIQYRQTKEWPGGLRTARPTIRATRRSGLVAVGRQIAVPSTRPSAAMAVEASHCGAQRSRSKVTARSVSEVAMAEPGHQARLAR